MSRTERADRAKDAGWILVVVGGVAVALGTLAAASGASEANGERQAAVRAQTKYTAATVSNVRKVYADEAPLVLAINTGLIRADELEKHASQNDPGLRIQARAERAAAAAYVRRFRAAQGPVNELVAGSDYEPGSGQGAPQLGRRLADLQAGNAALATELRTAQSAAAEAEQLSARGRLGAVAGVAVALLGFAFWWWGGASAKTPGPAVVSLPATPRLRAQAGRRGQRPRTPARVVSLGITVAGAGVVALRVKRRPLAGLLFGAAVGLVAGNAWRRAFGGGPARPVSTIVVEAEELPDVAFGPPELPALPPEENEGREPGRAWSPLPAVLLGLIAAVVTTGQISASVGESRLLADAARRADLVSAAVTGGLIRRTFVDNGKQSGLLLGQRADDLAEAGGDPAQAAADDATGTRVVDLAADIGVPPTADDGVDSFTRSVVSGSLLEAQEMVTEQQRAAAAAEVAGQRSDRLVVVLFALTLAASLIEIGRSLTRSPWPGRLTRTAGYLLAAAAGLYALAITVTA